MEISVSLKWGGLADCHKLRFHQSQQWWAAHCSSNSTPTKSVTRWQHVSVYICHGTLRCNLRSVNQLLTGLKIDPATTDTPTRPSLPIHPGQWCHRRCFQPKGSETPVVTAALLHVWVRVRRRGRSTRFTASFRGQTLRWKIEEKTALQDQAEPVAWRRESSRSASLWSQEETSCTRVHWVRLKSIDFFSKLFFFLCFSRYNLYLPVGFDFKCTQLLIIPFLHSAPSLRLVSCRLEVGR